MTRLRERITDISAEHRLSHLGSCLTAVDAIDAVFQVKKPDEKFVLSNGHAGLALYVVLEKHGLGNAEEMLEQVGIHADAAVESVDVSTGSLGQGLPIAVGMALGNRERNVYCMVSDGEMAEGSIWEALRVASEQSLTNLKVVLNANGWAAYRATDVNALRRQIRAFGWHTVDVSGDDVTALKDSLVYKTTKPLLVISHTNSDIPGFSEGLESHYKVMGNNDRGH